MFPVEKKSGMHALNATNNATMNATNKGENNFKLKLTIDYHIRLEIGR